MPERKASQIVADYLEGNRLDKPSKEELVALAEAILSDSAQGWPSNPYVIPKED